jgi:protein TonB
MIGPMLLSVVLASAAFASPIEPQSAVPQPPAPAAQEPAKPWPPAGVSRIGEGVTPPQITDETRPAYPAAARKAGAHGVVEMEAVIESDGKVGEVRVLHAIDSKYGLTEEAVKALKKWRFKPGKKDGVAVPVLVVVEMSFAVRR